MSEPLEVSPERRAAAAELPDRIAFLGLGLIGGSIALALRKTGYAGHIAAWTPAGRGPSQAASQGLIDLAASTASAALERAGLVVLAGPPLAILEVLHDLAGSLRGALDDSAVITDVASTKARIVERASALGLPFVGGHPMAGREASGVEAATAELFEGRPWVVDDGEEAAGRDTVRNLATACGARVVSMPAALHDEAVAAISHVPLLISAALVEMADADGASGARDAARLLAASGWRDMSRLAKGDPAMGAGILATNAAPVRERLVAMRTTIDWWIQQLERGTPDARELEARLEAARSALADLGPGRPT